jgi:phosphotransferase system, enzyme I, PtsP
MDHVDLLLSISELNEILHETAPVREYLDHCVVIIARHFNAEVCSIYLYDPKQKRLKMGSTTIIGINPASINLELGEGLTGLVLKELRPIMTSESSRHPNYRYFPELHEERYEAYLGVPILRGVERIGVLVVQRGGSRPFQEADQKSLRGVANQIAAMIDYARLLIDNKRSLDASKQEQPALPSFIQGRPAAGGWGYGPVVIHAKTKDLNALPPESLTVERTLADFDDALAKTIKQLTVYQEKIEERLADAASLIFGSHILLLQDREFVGKVRNEISGGIQPAKALVMVSRQLIDFFSKQENPYFRQKADDIRDITFQVLFNLVPQIRKSRSFEKSVVVAADIVPSDILTLSASEAAGVILISGGATSHVAILARSLKLPMVIADVPALLELPEGSAALINGENGNVFINPEPAVRAPFELQADRRRQRIVGDEATIDPRTCDGVPIAIFANVNLISDAADAMAVNAKGVGLYRTEFPFIIRNSFPNEDEQYAVYRKLILGMRGLPVTFRTLDIGGDKSLSYHTGSKENNPFLGLRSMRFCLENREMFKSQIRAILRAGYGADIRIMFPMISSIDELEEVRNIFSECGLELTAEKAPFHVKPLLGIMIELPATLPIIHELAKRVDFFSIGTNDLIQYMLAVDRTNEKVAKYYCPHHPSILHAIKRISDAAREAGIGLSVCGDMAHENRYLEFMVGVGIRSMSIDPLYFSSVCTSLRSIDVAQAVKKADRLLSCWSIKEVESLLNADNVTPP